MTVVVANYNKKAQFLVDGVANWCDANGHELIAREAVDYDALMELCRGVDVLIATQRWNLGEEFFSAVPNLKMVIAWGSGYEQLDLKAAESAGIITANAGTCSNPDVAEIALIHIICASRKISGHLNLVRENRWNDRTVLKPMHRMKGRIVGLLGFGGIARELCWRLIGLGFKVVASDPFVDADEMAKYGVEKRSTEELFRESDFVSVHLRVTEETYHIINDENLGLMKPGSFVINTSRGALVDEEALFRALKEGSLAGAGLDVLETEPPSVDNPLLSMPQVMVTPHCGAGTEETHHEHVAAWISTLEDFAADSPEIRNRVYPLPSIG